MDISGGEVNLYDDASLTASGDIRFSNGADTYLYASGSWILGGNSHHGNVSIGGNAVSFTGSGTTLNFSNWTPPGATDIDHQVAELDVTGDLTIGSGVDVYMKTGDFIETNDYDCSISSGAHLHGWDVPTGSPIRYTWVPIWCGDFGALSGAFGSISGSPAGYHAVTGWPRYGANFLEISWDKD